MSESTTNLFGVIPLQANYDYLAPDGSEIRILSKVKGGGLAHCTLPAGRTSVAVQHQTVEEIWFFTSGQGQVWRKSEDYEQMVEVYQGVSLTIPLGTSFQFQNTGEVPLTFLITTIPRWPGSEEALEVEGYWKSR